MKAKIIKQLSENEFVIKLEDNDDHIGRTHQLKIAHDYVEFSGRSIIHTEDSSLKLKGDKILAGNCIYVDSSIQLPIRAFSTLIMPLLEEHKHLQPEHLEDRVHTEDDKHNNPPKYKKGDKYPAYAYHDLVIIIFHRDGIKQVAIWRRGESTPSIVSMSFYHEFVLPSLKERRRK